MFKQPPRGTDLLWWVIDPIDGTNNFAHRLLLFGVSIGIISRYDVGERRLEHVAN